MNNTRMQVTSSRSVNLGFAAVEVTVLNPSGAPLYLRIGAPDIPSPAGADIVIPPATYIAFPVLATSSFAVFVGAVVVPSQIVTPATIIFADFMGAVSIANVNLPQVLAQPIFFTVTKTQASGVTDTLLTPPAGRALVLYQIWGTGTSTASNTILAFIQRSSDAARIVVFDYSSPLASSAFWFFSPLTFAPGGLALPVGDSVTLTNGQSTTQSFIFQCLYALA